MLLTLTLSITLLAIITVFFINYNNYFLIRYCALFFSGLTLVLSTLIIFFFNKNYYHFQNVVSFNVGSDLVNTFFVFGLDGISLFFFFLTTLLTFLCILFIWKDLYFKQNVLLLFVIQFFLLIIFSILDLFLFYIFFEAILMPMYILIGFSGSRSRKVRAAYLFFFYTVCGSIFMHAGIKQI
jgi:NADH:ubiquinone oxidoreductase subunit 4 (subunit M)